MTARYADVLCSMQFMALTFWLNRHYFITLMNVLSCLWSHQTRNQWLIDLSLDVVYTIVPLSPAVCYYIISCACFIHRRRRQTDYTDHLKE